MLKDRQKVLIIGGDSAIGKTLSTALLKRGLTVWRTSRRKSPVSDRTSYLDLSEDINTWNRPRVQFSAVVFCAGVTSLSRCAANPVLTREINVVNTAAIAQKFSGQDALIIYLSTNLVFDGQKPFVGINEPANPQTEYGKQKAETEGIISLNCSHYAIVRFGKVILSDMPLFRKWIKELKGRKVIHPFSDMAFAPVSMDYAVGLLIKIITEQRRGVFHATGPEDITYSQAAYFIAEQMGLDLALIEPVTCRNLPGVTQSPRYAALSGVFNEDELGATGFDALRIALVTV